MIFRSKPRCERPRLLGNIGADGDNAIHGIALAHLRVSRRNVVPPFKLFGRCSPTPRETLGTGRAHAFIKLHSHPSMLNNLRIFLMPEGSTSLKLVFDNIRNYAICGALLLLGLWVLSQSATSAGLGSWRAPFGTITLQMSTAEMKVAGTSVLILAALLTFLNVLQTWLLLFHGFLPPQPGKSAPAVTHISPEGRSPSRMFSLLALTVVLPAFIYFAMQVFLNMLGLAAAFATK